MSVQVALEVAAPSRARPALPVQPYIDVKMASTLLATHMPGIDLLRGLAVIAVVIFHGMAYKAPECRWGSPLMTRFYGCTAWGWLGVNLFFVISGFLITGILDDTHRRRNFYPRFYLRRALRILPAYLAVIVLAWATGFISLNYIAVCLVFLANMPGLILHHGYLFYGPFWSLAVEEQFYLFWPVLYRKLRRKGMLILSLAILVICPLLRALAYMHLLRTGDALSKTWMIADNLAIGAVLAILIRWHGLTLRNFVVLGWLQFCLGLSGLAALTTHHRMGPQDVLRNSIGITCFLLLCGSAIVLALWLFRERRQVPWWMSSVLFFGEISYGLYLVHLLLLQIYDRAFGSGYQSDWRLLLIRFIVANGIAVAIATLSKRFFEDPILRLKSKLVAAR